MGEGLQGSIVVRNTLMAIALIIVTIGFAFLLILIPILVTNKWYWGMITYVSFLIGSAIWISYNNTHQRCPQCGYKKLQFESYRVSEIEEHEKWNCPNCGYKKTRGYPNEHCC